MNVRFLLVSEGSSERPLVAHLEVLCVRAGADVATGVAPDLSRLHPPPGRRLDQKLAAALRLEPDADLVFVHRDADRAGREARVGEIEDAVTAAAISTATVPVIPVRALEAWLLLDEAAIRTVAGNPRGTEALELPSGPAAERVADPKRALAAALVTASGASGRRLAQVRRSFPAHRARLIDLLDTDGPVAALDAWRQLVSDTQSAISALGAAHRDR